MAISNHERVGKALDLVKDGLIPFVERELKAQDAQRWLDIARQSVSETQERLFKEGAAPQWDVASLLAVLWNQWNVIFKKTLGQAERTLVSELRADPLTQLLARRPTEGDHQHLLQPGLALGDEAGDQRADGPGLAGAGARLQQRRAGGERSADVEGWNHRGPTFSAPVSSGSQIRQAYAGSPDSMSTSTGAESP